MYHRFICSCVGARGASTYLRMGVSTLIRSRITWMRTESPNGPRIVITTVPPSAYHARPIRPSSSGRMRTKLKAEATVLKHCGRNSTVNGGAGRLEIGWRSAGGSGGRGRKRARSARRAACCARCATAAVRAHLKERHLQAHAPLFPAERRVALEMRCQRRRREEEDDVAKDGRQRHRERQ